MRRRALLVLPLLAGCSVLPQRAYPLRRDWPLVVRRPADLPRAAPSRRVLLLRTIAAGPGLEGRGLQSVQPDGSVLADYYEQWVVPPAQGTEAALRQWLEDSGQFAAVLAPGSRATPDLVLEGELTRLDTGPDASAHATLSYVLLDQHDAVLRQQTLRGSAPVGAATPAARVAAMEAALAAVFGQAGIR
jgi:ABC-type uncharacterized transport system auxiliary subunit